jgi:hypothetical protein
MMILGLNQDESFTRGPGGVADSPGAVRPCVDWRAAFAKMGAVSAAAGRALINPVAGTGSVEGGDRIVSGIGTGSTSRASALGGVATTEGALASACRRAMAVPIGSRSMIC